MVLLGQWILVMSQGPPLPAGRRLVWSDEFTGHRLDAGKWATCYPFSLDQAACTNTGNVGEYAEAQCYTPDNVHVSGGHLVLGARRQAKTCDGRTKQYTSGLVQAHDRHDFTYGYVEMRAKVPAGLGLWPAFWLIPSDYSWPPEIDIMEIFGSQQHPTHSHHNLHLPDRPTTEFSYPLAQGTSFDAEFHVFAVDWQPSQLSWYVDSRLVHRVTGDVPAMPAYPVINLALRETLVQPESLPARLLVDHVRIYT
jgi:beta-glucanase (GH16 family)